MNSSKALFQQCPGLSYLPLTITVRQELENREAVIEAIFGYKIFQRWLSQKTSSCAIIDHGGKFSRKIRQTFYSNNNFTLLKKVTTVPPWPIFNQCRVNFLQRCDGLFRRREPKLPGELIPDFREAKAGVKKIRTKKS